MKGKFYILILSLLFSLSASAQQVKKNPIPEKKDILLADTTVVYVHRDTCDLKMDIYYPVPGSETRYNGKEKPALLYIFGGGFVSGERDAVLQLRWYKRLIEEGFRVVAIDYRLGLKGIDPKKISKIKMIGKLEDALNIALEDLYAATNYLIQQGAALGIDADNLVVSGSSAGAMTVLQADYQISNPGRFKTGLPPEYRYKGVISFSGGVFSREGRPDYELSPAPTLLMHGMEDHIVPYKKLQFFRTGFFGSDKLLCRLKKYDANYSIYRYVDSGHEVAASFTPTLDDQLDFIYVNVMDGRRKLMDVTLEDPGIDSRFKIKRFKDAFNL